MELVHTTPSPAARVRIVRPPLVPVRRRSLRFAASLPLLLVCVPALAQQLVANTTLGGVGLTELEILTGDAVQTVCGAFVANVDNEALNADQADLFDKCGEMVHTANRLVNNDGPVAKDLGLDRTELRAALRNIAGEEIAAAGSLATEAVTSQSAGVGARLAAILSRSASLQVSALNRRGSGGLLAANRGASSVPSGGGASDDDPLGVNRWGVFVNAAVGGGEKDATDGEDGYEAAAQGVTVGADYRFGGSAALGAAFGFSNSETDFDESAAVSGGGLDAESTTFSAYALWYGSRYYADGIVSVGSGTYDLERRIVIPSEGGMVDAGGDPNDGANRTATASTDSTQLRVSVSGGAEYTQEKLTFAPYARLSLLTVDLDGYEEAGAGGLNLSVADQEIESMTTSLGYRLVGTFSTAFAILSPQLNFEWVHEFSDDSREIISTYLNDPRSFELIAITDGPDRDYYTAGVGITAALRNRMQLYGDVKTLLDLDDVSEYLLTLGVRFAL